MAEFMTEQEIRQLNTWSKSYAINAALLRDDRTNIALLYSLLDPSSPYGLYANMDRFLNVPYRIANDGALNWYLNKYQDYGMSAPFNSNSIPLDQVRPLNAFEGRLKDLFDTARDYELTNRRKNSIFEYNRMTDLYSQYLWSSTSLIGIGYSANNPNLGSLDTTKKTLAQLALFRSSALGVLETAMYMVFAVQYQPRMAPNFGPNVHWPTVAGSTGYLLLLCWRWQ